MTTPQIITVPADTVVELDRSPFLPKNPALWQAAAPVTVHNAFLPGRDARNGNYQRWVADGNTDTWTEDEILNLVNAHDDAGALQPEDVLRVVVKVNGVVLTRVDSGGPAPGPGEFTCVEVAGDMTLTFNADLDAGAIVELFLCEPLPAVDLLAGVPQQARSPQVVFADGEAFQAIRLTQ